MTSVLLGNSAPLMADGSAAEHLQQSVTRVDLPPGHAELEWAELALSTNNDRVLTGIGRQLSGKDRRYALAVRDLEDLWSSHSAAPPAWVASDDEDLERILAAYFDCPRGEPTMLLTTVGRDALHGQHIATAAQPAAFSYEAYTANATAPAASDTTLTAEIATAGGGLIRGQGTVAHTAGTNTTTVTRTVTANGSDALPVTLAKAGLFNAAAAGTMGYTTLLNATATLTVAGDNMTSTRTATIG